jgi:hypothetical protein
VGTEPFDRRAAAGIVGPGVDVLLGELIEDGYLIELDGGGYVVWPAGAPDPRGTSFDPTPLGSIDPAALYEIDDPEPISTIQPCAAAAESPDPELSITSTHRIVHTLGSPGARGGTPWEHSSFEHPITTLEAQQAHWAATLAERQTLVTDDPLLAQPHLRQLWAATPPQGRTVELRDHLIALDRRQACSDVVEPLLAQLLPILETHRHQRLVRLSLRTPPWNASSLDSITRAFVTELDTSGTSTLLAVDVDEGGTPHLYGFALTDKTNEEISELWCSKSGSTRASVDVRTVTGWRAYAETGELENGRWGLRPNLVRSLHYAMKPWASSWDGRDARDLDRDVYTSGAFAKPWHRVRISAHATDSITRARACVAWLAERGARLAA